jgi:ectoine hydroxylase-related dioxygenase (phytanoyl-CoA dioxygenase family)
MPHVDGVYSRRNPLSWPFLRPTVMLELMPQLMDRGPVMRAAARRPEIQSALDDLDREGVAILENVAPKELVAAGIEDLNRFVEMMPQLQGLKRTKRASKGGTREYNVHEYQQKLNIYRSHDPLMFSPAYARFLLLPDLIAVVQGYLGKHWLYQAMIATRTEPSEPIRAGFASWHHDARGRKLNIILLLTDVPEDGPTTMVLRGSHRLVYTRSRQVKNFFSDDEQRAIQDQHNVGPERVCHAPAGSLVLFDSNALHLGRRSQHRRDAFQVNCMTDREQLWSHEIPRELLASLDAAERESLLARADLRPV